MIKVLKSGILTTIQDRGRAGFGRFGVPFSGAMDKYAANLVNHILNNGKDDAVIEITFGNCAFQFLVDSEIVVSGAYSQVKVNNIQINLNTRVIIKKNDIVSFNYVTNGVRCYLGVKGGILSEKVLGSRSQYINITKKHRLKKDDILPIRPCISTQKSFSSIKIHQNQFLKKELDCFKGPEFYLLSKDNQQEIFKRGFTISSENSRMGYKLQELLKNTTSQMLTSSVMPGTVQLTPSGTLIILMRDCQVTGGYPRVLQLTENAINKLAQKTTSQLIRFSPV